MANLDHGISYFFASMNGKLPAFDRLMLTISSNDLLKGGIIAALLWHVWFAELGRHRRVRSKASNDRLAVLQALLSCVVAELLARLLSLTLPFRPRPLFNSSLPFKLPEGITLESLRIATESSFPSDHAVMFFAMSAAIAMISRRAGVFAFIWVLVIVAFPRLYLGLHYFSDLMAGAAIGILVALAGCRLVPPTRLLKTAVLRSRTHPAFFYPFFFLLMHQVANMLDDLRDLGAWVKTL